MAQKRGVLSLSAAGSVRALEERNILSLVFVLVFVFFFVLILVRLVNVRFDSIPIFFP